MTIYDQNGDRCEWEGSGWYAPCQEGRYQNQHTAYYRCAGRQEEAPDTRGLSLGTPTWFETKEDFTLNKKGEKHMEKKTFTKEWLFNFLHNCKKEQLYDYAEKSIDHFWKFKDVIELAYNDGLMIDENHAIIIPQDGDCIAFRWGDGSPELHYRDTPIVFRFDKKEQLNREYILEQWRTRADGFGKNEVEVIGTKTNNNVPNIYFNKVINSPALMKLNGLKYRKP